MAGKVTFYRPTLNDLPREDAEAQAPQETTAAVPPVYAPEISPIGSIFTRAKSSEPAASTRHVATYDAPLAQPEALPAKENVVRTAFELEGRRPKREGVRPEVAVNMPPQLKQPMSFTFNTDWRAVAAAAAAGKSTATSLPEPGPSIASTVTEIRAATAQKAQGLNNAAPQGSASRQLSSKGPGSPQKGGRSATKRGKADKVILTIILVILALIIGYAVFLRAHSSQAPTAAQPVSVPEAAEIVRISPKDAKAAVDAGQAVLVDTRAEEAYARQHAEGAISLPESRAAELAGTLPQDKILILYCT